MPQPTLSTPSTQKSLDKYYERRNLELETYRFVQQIFPRYPRVTEVLKKSKL